MSTGTVRWFKAEKGYGFIVPDDGGPDLFVHIAAVRNAGLMELRGGQSVVFDAQPDRRTGRMGVSKLAIVNQSARPDTSDFAHA